MNPATGPPQAYCVGDRREAAAPRSFSASRTSRRCTPNFRATPWIVPIPNSYSRRISSNSSTFALLSTPPLAPAPQVEGRVVTPGGVGQHSPAQGGRYSLRAQVMSLTSYRAAPPRVEVVAGRAGAAGCGCATALRSRVVTGLVGRGLVGGPGGDLLSHALRRSTMGAAGFHGRVRNGSGGAPALSATRSTNHPKGSDRPAAGSKQQPGLDGCMPAPDRCLRQVVAWAASVA